MRDVNSLPTPLALYPAKAGGFVMYGGGSFRGAAATVWYYTTSGAIGEAPELQEPLTSLASFWELVAC